MDRLAAAAHRYTAARTAEAQAKLERLSSPAFRREDLGSIRDATEGSVTIRVEEGRFLWRFPPNWDSATKFKNWRAADQNIDADGYLTGLTLRLVWDPRREHESRMSLYKAVIFLERFLLGTLVPTATRPFEIAVTLPTEAEFLRHFDGLESTPRFFTGEWINEALAGRIFAWLRDVVPTFSKAFVTNDYLDTLHVSSLDGGTSSARDALESRHDVSVGVLPPTITRAFVLDKARLVSINLESENIRWPCKKQGTMTPENVLTEMPLVDLQGEGFDYNVLVRYELFKDAVNRSPGGRVFSLFPSFDSFAGLRSREAGINAVSALHCNLDPEGTVVPTTFKTFGITRSAGESLVNTRGDACFPTGKTFRIRRPGTDCGDQSMRLLAYTRHEDGEGGDPCCTLSMRRPLADGVPDDVSTSVAGPMAIYGSRTRTPNPDFLPAVQEAYEWFAGEFPELVKEITLRPSWNASDGIDTLKIFTHFLPQCESLVLVIDGSLEEARRIARVGTTRDLVNHIKYHFTSNIIGPPQAVGLLDLRPVNSIALEFTRNHLEGSDIMVIINRAETMENLTVVLKAPYPYDPDPARDRNPWRYLVGALGMKGYTHVVRPSLGRLRMKKGHVVIHAGRAWGAESSDFVTTMVMTTKFERRPVSTAGKRRRSPSAGPPSPSYRPSSPAFRPPSPSYRPSSPAFDPSSSGTQV